MHISDFDFELPPDLIAREPARPRDLSRMMIVDRQTGALTDSTFKRFPDYIHPGDVLVVNDTRVIRARMFGALERTTGTGRNIELLFVEPISSHQWKVMCKPGRRIRAGDRVIFEKGGGSGVFGESVEEELRQLTVEGPSVAELLERHGHIPLPPYLERAAGETDLAEYQTVFASKEGAIAAPTAGLHFTPAILDRIRERGAEVVPVTLNVGLGTFLPIRTDDPQSHRLRPEWFNVSSESAERLTAARARGNRIIAVGTTSTRTIEYLFQRDERFQAASGHADLFILPGHKFGAVDSLLTNFHLPKSTLLMLVSAFASRQLILDAYRHAIEQRYRFYSYGDCMLIL